ncbi:MAG: MBL fold metallo-hydrolase [Planctomycetota bacterium]|nr:MAG: MBL fold metallo-hydrolase [Planctomycetota bacterium]
MENKNLSRRVFLHRVGVGTLGLATGSLGQSLAVAEESESITRLTEHLIVYHGHINVGIVRDGNKAFLIDCGDGSVANVLEDLEIRSVDQVIFTHHHRDQVCGAHPLAVGGTRIGVPAAERDYFDKVADYWNDPKNRWHVYCFHPHHIMLAEPVRVDITFSDGDVLRWGPAKIRVLTTPGHTDGSVSYLVEVDGQKVIFSGDVIADEGRVWDIHSLQKGFRRGNRQIRDYHGFLGARTELVESLGRLKSAKPDTLVPSHGHVMTDPIKAIDKLIQRLEVCYDKYVSISALRHYFPELFVDYADRKDHMVIRKGKTPPTCLRHYGTTWILLSKDKAALVMDCGANSVVRKIRELIDEGEISAVEGLWVTHYHDDHVDAIPEFQKTFNCPCITDRSVARVISNPLAWRLPCVSPNKARVDRATNDGESWQWREFKMTAYHLPGQTLYHSGLLVEGQGLRMLFVGDSFTASGIDDYCTSNRNWLGRGVGFDRCIALIEKLKPTHIFNCHVKEAFDFTPEQCHFMRANLAERERTFGELVLWDHANYGMDEQWVRCYPYEQQAKAGTRVELRVVVTNHSKERRTLSCRAVLPRLWDGRGTAASTNWAKADIPAKKEGEVALTLDIPADAQPGRYVIPIDVRYGTWNLPQFTEGIVTV